MRTRIEFTKRNACGWSLSLSLCFPLFVLMAIMYQEEVDYVRAVHGENEENCTTRGKGRECGLGYRSYSCITTFSRRLFFPSLLFQSIANRAARTEGEPKASEREGKKRHPRLDVTESKKMPLGRHDYSAGLISLLLLVFLLTPSL